MLWGFLMHALTDSRAPDGRSPPGLRMRLRKATAAAHQALDTQVTHSQLADLTDYRHFLEASAAALIPLEAALEDSDVSAIVDDWCDRTRANAIRIDLARVGGHVHPLPPVKRLGRAEMLGALYVLEGSRLGAKYLLRTAKASSDPVVAGATAYLGHGEDKPLWPTFLAVLERESPSVDEADAIAGAAMAFDLFSTAFARP